MENKYTFKYSDSMEKYRKDNDVQNKIVHVKLKDSNQLKNKFPKFVINIESDYGSHESIVQTRKLPDNTFQVEEGWGQLSFGTIQIC